MRCATLTKPGSGIGSGSKIISFTSCLVLQHRSIAPIDPYKAGGMRSSLFVANGVMEQVRNAPSSGVSIDDYVSALHFAFVFVIV